MLVFRTAESLQTSAWKNAETPPDKEGVRWSKPVLVIGNNWNYPLVAEYDHSFQQWTNVETQHEIQDVMFWQPIQMPE